MNDYFFYFKKCLNKYGLKAFHRQFYKDVRRPFSRALFLKYAPHGNGLEIGVGNQSIAPKSRTLFSDAFKTHGKDKSIAEVFFPAHLIPHSDETFSFILSEHMLEHSNNPLGIITEWKRVLKKEGILFLFLPHFERTFDRERKLTELSHLIEDEKRGFNNDKEFIDETHLLEWNEKVILKKRAPAYLHLSIHEMNKMGMIHHHVWNTEKVVEFLEYKNFEILETHDLVIDRKDSLVVVAKKR